MSRLQTVGDVSVMGSRETGNVNTTVYLFMPDTQRVGDLVYGSSNVLAATPKTEELSAPRPTNR